MSLDHEASEAALPDRLRLSIAKLSPPTLTPHAIARTAAWPGALPRRTKLMLFAAPAGFGKTTTMLQWIERMRNTGTAIAWVTLDT